MNRGLLLKIFRETWILSAGLCVAVIVFELLMTFAFSVFKEEFAAQILEFAFIRNIIQAILGAEIGPGQVGLALMSVTWVHPLLLGLVWTHAVTFCTRTPAGEVDRGTADLWLTLPVSRVQVLATESAAVLASAILLTSCVFAGNRLGTGIFAPDLAASGASALFVCVNFLSLYLAAAAVAFLSSAFSNRRGSAIAAAFAFLAGSYLLNVVTQFAPVASFLAPLSIMHYYQPMAVLREQQGAISHVLILLSFALICWLVSLWRFATRDILTA
ncbi:MAG: hypothetical protein J5J06_00330 [Phycisphaerae bacterium]|nr:hypothetical protein [Phycisphaerae bacterium]